MTDPSRYDQLSPLARALVDDYDALDLAEMLVAAQDEHANALADVHRVIALYEQWVKAGPPPLGTPMARWWDKRLVELHHAILPPAPAATEATEPQEQQ